MARAASKQKLMPSLLDRLIDPALDANVADQGYDVEHMIEVVRRDLEDLLNTRQTTFGIPHAFAEVRNSIVRYGLPDLASMNAVTEVERSNIGELIAIIVNRFEPRLRDVNVVLEETDSSTERTVNFHISAKLNVDPSPEVGFETILELTTGHTSIKRKDVG